jgi:hypothetical protein
VTGPVQPVWEAVLGLPALPKVQFSNSVMFLLHICIRFSHFLKSVFVFILDTEAERKITAAGLYVGEGSENKTLPDLRSRPEAGTLVLLTGGRVYFLTLLLHKILRSPGVGRERVLTPTL